MNITMRIILAVAIPILALFAQGAFTRLQLGTIEEKTRFVAENRALALGTIGNLSRKYEEMRVQIRSCLLIDDASDQVIMRKDFDLNETQMRRLLDLYENTLVPGETGEKHYSNFKAGFAEWVVGAREILKLCDEGNRSEAINRLQGPMTQIGAAMNKNALDWIEYVQKSSGDAGAASIQAIVDSRRNLLLISGAALLFAMAIGFLTFQKIALPVRGLKKTVTSIAEGDFTQTVPYTKFTDEIGNLARSVEILKQGASAMEEQRWIKAAAAQLLSELQEACSLAEFGARFVSGIVPVLGGGVAGFYVHRDDAQRLDRVGVYGLAETSRATESFNIGKGLVGQCAALRRPVTLDNLPPEYLQIASGLGQGAPNSVTAWPVCSQDQLLGVFEFASFRALKSTEKALLDELLPVAGMSLGILARNLRTQDLLDQTQEQARLLEEQTEELTQSQEELLAQQEELLAQQEELTHQREELAATEERTRLILESTSEGIFGLDTEGAITFVNKAACQLLGFSPDELIGQPSHALVHHHKADGSDYPSEQCPMLHAYKNGKASRIENEVLWKKNGKSVPVEYGATPIRKEDEIIGAVISFSDITERQRAEQRIRDTEKFFRSVLELAPDGMVVSDVEGMLLVNARIESMFGYERDDLFGQPVEMLVPDGLREELHRAFDETPDGYGLAPSRELEARRQDGTLFPVEVGLSPLPARQGRTGHVAITIRDITERKLAERKIADSERRMRRILETTNEGFWLIDNDLATVEVNDALCQILRREREEILGRCIFDFTDEENKRVFKENVAKRARGEAGSYDIELLRSDGISVPCRVHATPLIDEDGVKQGAFAMFTDITEQKRYEEDLKRTNFQSDCALELTKAGYWRIPFDGSNTYHLSERAMRILGEHPSSDMHYPVEDWIENVRQGDEGAALIAEENFQAAMSGAVPVYDATYAYKRPLDGNIVWIHALGHVVKDEDGKPVDIYGVTQDITQFKMLEEQIVGALQKAEEATEMKSMFLANMSHEIRTPMNAIIGLSHLALKTQMNPKQRDYVSKVHNAGTALLAIINDILDFSKIEAGKLDIETTDFKIDEVIGSVTTVTAQKAVDKGLEFLADVSRDIPDRLEGDPLRLGQILTNLINNAVKFTEKGEIHLKIELLETTGEKVQLRFSVRDTGIGMTREQAARLFQPFSQADMSTTRKHGGTGLGLTICKRLVELMGGHIWLESEPGVGSAFIFTVWLGVSQISDSGRIVPERFERLHALVVDDNAAAREILVDSLAQIAEHVDSVSSGPEAIAAIRERDSDTPYDVVFMDWRMPVMDGLQATRIIKSDDTIKNQPAFVIVTAFGREEVREEAEELKVDGFIIKPVTKSMLVDSLVGIFTESGGEGSGFTNESKDDPNRLRGMRILLTEDNEINQQIALELLEGVGAVVSVANNGREAVDNLCNGPIPPPFNVILMDLQMPEMDGYQATARIRSDARFNDVPIIAMTAHATLEERQRCLNSGMDDHISKPIDPQLLFETLSRFHKPGMYSDATPVDTPVKVEAEPQVAEEVPVLDGLDTKDGLNRLMGNRKLYLKLLRQFADQQEKAPEQIQAALDANDTGSAERMAHTVKGVAGNIGAKELQQAAALLERTIAGKEPEADLVEVFARFSAVLNDFIGRLKQALPSGAETAVASAEQAPLDMEKARTLAAEMIGYLNNFDPAAGDCLESNQAIFKNLLGDSEFSEFEQNISGFAFTEALALLEPRAREKGLV